MGNQKALAGVLILAGLILGAVGYQKSQPTTAETIAGGVAKFATAVDPTGNRELKKAAKDINNAGFKRGLPFYAIGGIAVIAGFAVLLAGGKPS